MNRKEFLKTAAAGLIAASVPSVALRAAARSPHKRPERRSGRLSLAFEPYDLKLIHPFTVAVNTRTHTPDVQVTLEYDGITGYGEASMPPYLGETQESVCRFLSSLDLSRFTDPFRMDEILDYVDRAAPDNRAAKASVDLALHDLVGKLLGHTSINSTQVYADVVMETKIEAVNRISEFFEYGKKQKRNTII